MRNLWEEHSLTIVLAAIGVSTLALAFAFDEKLWDLFSGLGQGVLTGALVFWLSRYFRETAKPEDPPEILLDTDHNEDNTRDTA